MTSVVELCGTEIEVEGRLVRIARIHGEKFRCPADPPALIDALRDCGKRIDLFTFLQAVPDTVPKYTYPMEWDNLAVLPVSTFDHWFAHQIQSYARNRARQAGKRGVAVREVPFDDGLLEGICGIYNESPVRQGRRFPHYGMDREAAHRYAGTFLDRSIFIGAFVDGRMIGFIKLVTDETCTYACAIHVLSMLQHRDKSPTNALIAQAVRSCADRNISYLVYERFTYAKKAADGLTTFKEVNGFKRMDLPRYYIPLTRLGWLALRGGLHHRLAHHIPASVGNRLRAIRRAWYERRFSKSA